jgi:ferredoxin--NADP+ reductase
LDGELRAQHRVVAVIGAGPAGLFAAREIASQGARVFIFNRDIRPGGLAEYGIYPYKLKMKDGLRNQFREILRTPGIEYYGNLTVGETGDFSLDDLRRMGFQAVLVTVGAQGTKWLGLPGENLSGVYHAKDLVYHYNSLPPYSEQEFPIGRRAAIIGAGNVMLDIAHWLLDVKHVTEVVAVARRGPNEVKFDKKELENIVSYVDMPAVDSEIQRVTPQLAALGQDPNLLPEMIRGLLAKIPPQHLNGSVFRLQFLASPVRILGDEGGRVTGLEVEQTRLALNDRGETTARGTGLHQTLPVDTLVFAIGDRVDPGLGLPVEGNEYVKNPVPRFPMDGNSYEAFDPLARAPIEDVFVAGWARKASTGLVGVARKDGVTGARVLLQYLETRPPLADTVAEGIRRCLTDLGRPLVTLADLARLDQAERERAAALGLPEFKYDTNLEMLAAMGFVQPMIKA